jgi:hypothetical protein
MATHQDVLNTQIKIHSRTVKNHKTNQLHPEIAEAITAKAIMAVLSTQNLIKSKQNTRKTPLNSLYNNYKQVKPSTMTTYFIDDDTNIIIYFY